MRTPSAAVAFLVAAGVAVPFHGGERQLAASSIGVAARVRIRPAARILSPQTLVITPADIAAGSLEIPLEIEIRGEEPFLAFFSLTRADGVARIEAVDGRRAPPAGAWLICHPRSGSASERINAAVRLRLAPAAPPAAMSLPFRIAVRTLG